MITYLLLLGGGASILVWMFGFPRLWAGRAEISLYAATVGLLIGILCTVVAISAPYSSELWFGPSASGDGFAVLGLRLLSGGFALSSFIALGVTAIVGSYRRKSIYNEVSE